MIIKLKGADFSLNNINSLLNSWLISISGRNYVTASSNISSVDKNGSYVNTFTVKENYEVSNVVVTMGGVTQSGVVDVTSGAAGTTITINIGQVTGAVNIVFTGNYVGTGEEPEPEPEDPIVPDEGGSALDLSTLSLAHCNSSKMPSSDTNENLTYDQTTHELKVNDTGWYKVSYFTTPLQVGTEIEYTTNYSNKNTGNFVGIYTQEDLVNGVTEVNGSFWPAPSGFGMYAPGQGSTGSADYIVIWDKSNYKIKTSDSKFGDAFNGKTVKLKMLETGVKVYVDNEEITWGAGSTLAALTTGTNYYLGFHNNSSSEAPVAQTINYIGPIR